MITRIVGFGDSWIHGDGLVDVGDLSKASRQYREQHCLIGQLAECLQIPYDSSTVINYGTSGGSLQSTQWDFAQWAQQETDFSDTLVVVGLTESSRQSWWQRKFVSNDISLDISYMHNHTPGKDRNWEDFIKFYQIHNNDKSLWNINYWIATEFFHNWATVNQVKLVMFNIFPAPIESLHVIQPNWNMRGELAHLEHTVGGVTAPCKHPNKKGYKLLAEKLFLLTKRV